MNARLYLALVLCAACGGGGSTARQPDAGAMPAPIMDSSTAGASGHDAHDASGVNDASAAGAPAHDAGGICTYVPGTVAPNCPDDLPSGCVAPAPSYKDEVAPILQTYCGPCHRVGGLAPDKPFDTYTHVFKTHSTMLGRLAGCMMPPPCAPQPEPAERASLLHWLVCNAPNN